MKNLFKNKKTREAEMKEYNRRYAVVRELEYKLDNLYTSWKAGDLTNEDYLAEKRDVESELDYARWALNDYGKYIYG